MNENESHFKQGFYESTSISYNNHHENRLYSNENNCFSINKNQDNKVNKISKHKNSVSKLNTRHFAKVICFLLFAF